MDPGGIVIIGDYSEFLLCSPPSEPRQGILEKRRVQPCNSTAEALKHDGAYMSYSIVDVVC